MSKREDRIRLQHMLDASRQAVTFVHGRHRGDLDSDLQELRKAAGVNVVSWK